MNKITSGQMLLPALLACVAPAAASAQTAYLEQSGIAGVGKSISITRLPVPNSSGLVSYYDGLLILSVSSAGVPKLPAQSFKPSPPLQTSTFVPGRYYVKYDANATQFGSLSQGVGSGGSTVWSLVMEQNPDGDFPEQATWQTVSPAPDIAARLAAAKVPSNSPEYSYGITAVGGSGYGPQAFVHNNGLMAAEQVNNTLTLVSYTNYYNQDVSTQAGSITLNLCADSACSNAPK